MPAGFLDVFVGEDTYEDAESDDGAVGDLHEGRDKGAEAKAFDDNGAEVGDACDGRLVSRMMVGGRGGGQTAVGDVADHAQ